MKLFQKAFVFLTCVIIVVLMCAVPGYLMHYLETAFEWKRTDGIRETGPIGSLPIFIMLVVPLVPSVLFLVVSIFYVFRFAIRSFKHYGNVHKGK